MRTIPLILVSTITYGQTDLFEKQLSIDRTHEEAARIIRSRDGNNIIVGSLNDGRKDIYLVKVNDKGDTLWTRKYGADNVDDYATDIVAISNGYAVCGSTRTYSKKGKDDAFLLLIDENGKWTGYPKVFGSEFDDEAKRIIQTKDGNLVMVIEKRPTQWYAETFIIKVNLKGDRIWSGQLPDIHPTFGSELIEDPDGDVIFGGTATNQFEKDRDILLVRFNGKDGQIKWHKQITGQDNYHESLLCLLKNKAGNYLIAGLKVSPAKRYLILYTTDKEGNIIGDKIYNIDDLGETYSTSAPRQMIEAKDGNLIIVGNKSGHGFIFKLTQSGESIFFRKFGGQFSSIVELSTGELILTGEIIDPTHFWNLYLVRTNDQGKIE